MIPKIRVWDKKRSEMINLIAINFHKYIPMDDLICSCNDGPITRNFQDVVLMQSTGLHDDTKFEDLSEEEQEEWLESGKTADEWQGREIFKGDIVEIIYDGELFTGVVVYDLGEADFKATNGHEEYGNNFQYLTVGESIEVIGNIYENPELLEDV